MKSLLRAPLAALLALGSLSGPAFALDAGVNLLGHQSYGAGIQYSDVWYQDGLAFIGTLSTPGKVFIANASDASLVGTYPTSNNSWVKDLQAEGNILYVALDQGGIDIVDISNPAAPVRLTRYNTSASGVHDLAIHGNTLYYVDDTSSSPLHIADVTNPAAPQNITTFTPPSGMHDMTVVGNHAYLANGNGGFQILDVTNPATPVVLATQTLPGAYTHNIWPNGDERYVCTTDETCGTGHLRIWDVSNLGNIHVVGEYEVPSQGNTCVHNAMWVDNFIYMSYYRWGTRIIDATNPAAPLEVANYQTYSGAPGCFVGAWGVYAERSGSGSVRMHISDISSGLWAFDFPSAPNLGVAGVGAYDPAIGVFYLRDTPTAGPADTQVRYGPTGANLVGLSGDWDGNGTKTMGIYDPATGVFYLRNSNTAGNADYQFQYGPPGSTWVPVVGDWDGDDVESIGLYDPSTGVWYLKNKNAGGPADLQFQYGPGGNVARPVVGDWDATRTDTVGIYVPSTGVFNLRNANTAGFADIAFQFGPTGSNWKPVAESWDGVDGDSIGLYDPATRIFYLRNTNTAGPADRQFVYGPGAVTPLGGDWAGPGH